LKKKKGGGQGHVPRGRKKEKTSGKKTYILVRRKEKNRSPVPGNSEGGNCLSKKGKK